MHREYGARWCTGGVRRVHAGVDLKTHHAAGRRTQAHGSLPSFLIRPIRFQFNLLIGVVPFEVGVAEGFAGCVGDQPHGATGRWMAALRQNPHR